jgi:hypothetical protein
VNEEYVEQGQSNGRNFDIEKRIANIFRRFGRKNPIAPLRITTEPSGLTLISSRPSSTGPDSTLARANPTALLRTSIRPSGLARISPGPSSTGAVPTLTKVNPTVPLRITTKPSSLTLISPRLFQPGQCPR